MFRQICLALLLVVPLFASAQAQEPIRAVKPKKKVLAVIPLSGAYPEYSAMADTGFALFPQPLSFRKLLERFDEATDDPKVSAIMVKMRGAALSTAQRAELGRKLQKIRKTKKVFAYMEQASGSEFMLGSNADQVLLHPHGLLMFNGLRLEMMFFKDLFDWAGIEFEVTAAGKFKSAGEPFVRNTISEANKEAMGSFLDAIYNNIVNEVGKNRSFTPEEVKTIIDEGPYLPADALAKKLVDQTISFSEFIDSGLASKDLFNHVNYDYGSKDKQTEDINPFTLLTELLKGPKIEDINQPTLAVVFAQGTIVDKTEGGLLPLGGEENIVGYKLASLVKTLRYDNNVKGLVLRINSPGGSALASEIMRHELEAFAKEKLLVVSMGDFAASGGYYMAAPAKKIFAEANTLTGSIGVFGMSISTRKMMEKLKINTEVIERGANAGQFNGLDPLNTKQKAWMRKMINQTYDQFVGVVASGRGLEKDKVHEIAQGRVWTGTQAKANGLVDEIGGLENAISFAQRTLGGVNMRYYPRKKTLAEMLQGGMHMQAKAQAPAAFHVLPGWVKKQAKALSPLVRTDGKPMIWAVNPVIFNLE